MTSQPSLNRALSIVTVSMRARRVGVAAGLLLAGIALGGCEMGGLGAARTSGPLVETSEDCANNQINIASLSEVIKRSQVARFGEEFD